MSLRVRTTAACLTAGLLGACSAPSEVQATRGGAPFSPPPEAAEPAGSEGAMGGGRYGLFVLTHDADESGVAVSGQLAVFTGFGRNEVLHALTGPEVAWLAAGTPAPGRCRAVAAPHAGLDDGGDGAVDLLAAGDLTVQAPASPGDAPEASDGAADAPDAPDALRLAPRAFPRLLFSMGGLIYDADAPEALPYVPGGTYRLSAPGDEVGPIAAEIRAPGPVAIESAAVGPGGLEVRYSARGGAIVTVTREVAGAARGVQCRVAAPKNTSGTRVFTVPAAALAELGVGEALLSVAELGRRRVAVSGLSALDLFFVSRDQTVLRLPPETFHDSSL